MKRLRRLTKRRILSGVLSGVLLTILFAGLHAGMAFGQEKILKMSTTTSTEASGLLDVLLPEFEKDTGIRIKVFAKGTGAAIRDGMDGNVDVIFVHDREREEKFVSEGYGTKRYAAMHNDFIILGPENDPAGIKGIKEAPAALKRIAEAKALFVSRGDDSGTHATEQAVWGKSGVSLKKETTTLMRDGKQVEMSFLHPDGLGSWYLSIGQGMGKALTFADEKRAYVLTDRGTFINYKFGKDVPLKLEILCEGDDSLANFYGVIPVNPAKFPHVKYDLAEAFANWLVSPRGQKVIGGYQLLGKQLFFPDAIK